MKPRVEKLMGRWIVRCDCQDNTFGFLLGSTWAKAKDHQTAIALATWHAEMHAQHECPTCGHHQPVAAFEVVDPDAGLLRHDGRLHQIVDGRVRRLEVAR